MPKIIKVAGHGDGSKIDMLFGKLLTFSLLSALKYIIVIFYLNIPEYVNEPAYCNIA